MTLSLIEDKTLRQIAEHLYNGLNFAYAQVSGDAENKAVLAWAVWDAFAFKELPLLTVARLGSKNELLNISDLAITYYLPPNVEQDDIPEVLNWVEKNIARLLGTLKLAPLSCFDSDLDLTSKFFYGKSYADATVSFVRVFLTIKDPHVSL